MNNNIVCILNLRLNTNYNKIIVNTNSKLLNQNTKHNIDRITTKFFIIIKNTTTSSIQEINEHYQITASRVLFEISKYKDIEMATCNNNSIIIVNAGKLINFFIKTNTLNTIFIKHYENSIATIHNIISNIIKQQVQIIDMTKIDNNFIFLAKSNNDYVLIKARLSMESRDSKLQDIVLINKLNITNLSILYDIPIVLIKMEFYDEHLYILANSIYGYHIIKLVYYRMFDVFGYTNYFSKLIENKKAIAFTLYDKQIYILTNDINTIQFTQDFKNILQGHTINLNKIEYY